MGEGLRDINEVHTLCLASCLGWPHSGSPTAADVISHVMYSVAVLKNLAPSFRASHCLAAIQNFKCSAEFSLQGMQVSQLRRHISDDRGS